MRSVRIRDTGKLKPHPTVEAIIQCLAVEDDAAYTRLCDAFDELTKKTQEAECSEKVQQFFLAEREFSNPVTTQMIVRVHDQNGHALKDFDFLLTAWNPDDPNPALRNPNPNLLPPGFFIDRQRNQRTDGTVTYYLNHEVMRTTPALGLRIQPRPAPDPASKKASEYLVHYLNAELAAKTHAVLDFVRPNATLMVDIEMKRIVRSGVFRLTTDLRPRDFTHDEPGEALP